MNMRKKLALCWRILKVESGNLEAHAMRELPPADGDKMNALMNDQLLEMLTVFSTHGHSGFSASYATNTLELLLRYKPLRPLTGEASEWNEVGDGYWQNNRCSHVFKHADGKAYDIDGKVFREPNGVCYTGAGSRVYVTFPYTPKTEYVDVQS